METALQKFQTRIGVSPDNSFGKNTLKTGVEYLKLTPEQGAHFFAQLSHESMHFTVVEENLNYSAKGLLNTFKKYFTSLTAQQYARKPQMIANKVYANRMDNGNEASGDGWKYRGRGFIQLTGKANYTAFSKYVGKSEIVANPDLVKEDYAMESALFFFKENNLWGICNVVNDAQILKLTRRINGGEIGLAHRSELTKKFYSWLV